MSEVYYLKTKEEKEQDFRNLIANNPEFVCPFAKPTLKEGLKCCHLPYFDPSDPRIFQSAIKRHITRFVEENKDGSAIALFLENEPTTHNAARNLATKIFVEIVTALTSSAFKQDRPEDINQIRQTVIHTFQNEYNNPNRTVKGWMPINPREPEGNCLFAFAMGPLFPNNHPQYPHPRYAPDHVIICNFSRDFKAAAENKPKLVQRTRVDADARMMHSLCPATFGEYSGPKSLTIESSPIGGITDITASLPTINPSAIKQFHKDPNFIHRGNGLYPEAFWTTEREYPTSSEPTEPPAPTEVPATETKEAINAILPEQASTPTLAEKKEARIIEYFSQNTNLVCPFSIDLARKGEIAFTSLPRIEAGHWNHEWKTVNDQICCALAQFIAHKDIGAMMLLPENTPRTHDQARFLANQIFIHLLMAADRVQDNLNTNPNIFLDHVRSQNLEHFHNPKAQFTSPTIQIGHFEKIFAFAMGPLHKTTPEHPHPRWAPEHLVAVNRWSDIDDIKRNKPELFERIRTKAQLHAIKQGLPDVSTEELMEKCPVLHKGAEKMDPNEIAMQIFLQFGPEKAEIIMESAYTKSLYD